MAWGWQFFWTGSAERHEIAQAWTRRDPAKVVEFSRLLGWILLVLCLPAGIIFVAAAGGAR